MLLKMGICSVDDQEYDIRECHLFEGGAERGDDGVRKFTDESDRIDKDNRLPVLEADFREPGRVCE
jgi:hypothetical protein